ncbi:MAG: hypothetical protein JWP10_498, partial [Nocardioidaceae bacterium]|nr:hypothetical protein [Nocardioidaceae bacterium]
MSFTQRDFEGSWPPELGDHHREGMALTSLTFGLLPGTIALFAGWLYEWGAIGTALALALGLTALVLGWALIASSWRWTTAQKLVAAAVPIPLGIALGIFIYTLTRLDI